MLQKLDGFVPFIHFVEIPIPKYLIVPYKSILINQIQELIDFVRFRGAFEGKVEDINWIPTLHVISGPNRATLWMI